MKTQLKNQSMRSWFPVNFVLLAFAGCMMEPRPASELTVISGGGYQGVVIPIEVAESQPRLSRRYDGFWLPDSRDVIETEAAISAYLAEADTDATLGRYTLSQLPTIRQKLDRYRRQYVGVLVGDEKRIFCNVLTPDQQRYRDWQTSYIHLTEGAPDCWRIEYVLETQRCRGFSADFGY